MSGLFELVKHYPWLPSLKEYYSDIESKDPIDFINEIFSSDNYHEVNKRILNLFELSFENIEIFPNYTQDDINIYLYLLLRILLYVLDNKIIANRIANLYSKTTYNELNKESDYNLYYIYQDLNLDVIYEQEPIIYKKIILKDQIQIIQTNFKIYFIDYLKLSSRLKDEYRKLINNPVSNGYVLIQPKSLNRLIQEYVRKKFIINRKVNNQNLSRFKDKLFKNQNFKTIFEKINAIWELKKEEFEYSFEIGFKKGEDISKDFPPCIKEIHTKIKEGQNLIHTERLFLTWFLNALKYPEDEIINVFSSLPDFDRDKTAYQVRYAIKKGYTPYSCQSLKSMNLCMAKQYKDTLCLEGYFSNKLAVQKQISHPLFYVQFNQFKSSKRNFVKNETLKKND